MVIRQIRVIVTVVFRENLHTPFSGNCLVVRLWNMKFMTSRKAVS